MMTSLQDDDVMNIKLVLTFLLIKEITDQAKSERNSRDELYRNFRPDQLSETQYARWVQGTPCPLKKPPTNGQNDTRQDGSNETLNQNVSIFCPMVFETTEYTKCCEGRCCADSEDTLPTLIYVGIGIASVLACVVIGIMFICLYNKCTSLCVKKDSESTPPRSKIKFQANSREVHPVDNRVILKTANYTVEKSWDQLHVKFFNREFFTQFSSALLDRYQDVTWKDIARDKEGHFKSSSGDSVSLRILSDPRILIVSKPGNVYWVMNDFQNICKNLSDQEWSEKQPSSRRSAITRPLEPRLPTIGEEYHESDYTSKISQTETEVKFTSEEIFQNFKRVLLHKHQELTWSKYLQRDCAQIRLSSGKSVTLHLWEDIRTVWISGDGKKEWYQNEFQDFVSEATSKFAMEALQRTGYQSDNGSIYSRSSVVSKRDTPNVYTVKTLDSGGFEIEFPSQDFLTQLKDLLQMSHPSITWETYMSRELTKIALGRNKTVTVHLSTLTSRNRKMWIYDEPGNKDWFNTEFKGLYALAYDNIHRPLETHQSSSSPITPVESAV